MSEKPICKYCGIGIDKTPFASCPKNSEHHTYHNSEKNPSKRKMDSLAGTSLDPIFDDNSSYNYMDDD